MSLQLPFGVEVLNPTPADVKEGPYTSVSNANASIPSGVRYPGLRVLIGTAPNIELYVYSGGIADTDLKPFLSNETYTSGLWNGVLDRGVSADKIYQALNGIGFLTGNTAYVDPVGGNDSTAVLGNILKPYQTIGAGISALGSLPNSTLAIQPGIHIINDSNAPFGLKSPNSNYRIVCAPGVTIQSFCSYGVYIFDGFSDPGSISPIIGYPIIQNLSSTCTGISGGVSGAIINIASKANTTVVFQFEAIFNEDTGNLTPIRINQPNGFSTVFLQFISRSYSRSSADVPVIKIAPNSNCSIQGIGSTSIDAVNETNSTTCHSLNIENPNSLVISNIIFSSRGNAFGFTNTDFNVKLTCTVNANRIEFNNVQFIFVQSKPTGRNIDFQNSTNTFTQNIMFNNCFVKNRPSNLFSLDGYSLYSQNTISAKFINTLSQRDIDPVSASISNLLSVGIGFAVDSNL